jgi:hypothetical protein
MLLAYLLAALQREMQVNFPTNISLKINPTFKLDEHAQGNLLCFSVEILMRGEGEGEILKVGSELEDEFKVRR